MNSHEAGFDAGHSDDPKVERLDLVLDRVVDRCATPEDWNFLDGRLRDRKELALELVSRLREDDILRASLVPVRERADAIELPRAPAQAHPAKRSFVFGFAAALLIGLGLYASGLISMSRGGSGTNATPDESARVASKTDDLLAKYVEQGRRDGRVLQELPKVPLSMRPVADDPDLVHVVYVRRIVECTRIREAERFATDEHGRTVALPPMKLSNYIPRDI